MNKIKSLADLKAMKENLQKKLSMATKDGHPAKVIHVKIAMATCGIASGAKTVKDFMTEELGKRSIEAVVTQTGCMGYCYAEPTVEITLPGSQPVVFGYVDIKKADEIIEKYIKNGELVDGIIPENYESI